MGEFVHLHLHTEYSLLDGAARISEIAEKAIAEGQSAVAITDHGVMYGAVDFYLALKEKGIKPIIGCEVYVAPRTRFLKEGRGDSSGHHLILLCKNETGYRNLCYMVSESFVNGFYMRPRIDMDLLREHAEGLVALSGCLAGKIPSLILAGSMSEAEKYALEMKALFGADFYLEVQNHHMDDERRVAFGLKTISEKYGIPMVATNDVHYLERSDADIQTTLLCIQTNNVITEGKPFGFETNEYYFRGTAEMQTLFSAFPGAVENTVKIAEKCNFDFEFGKLYLPNFTSEDGMTHAENLRRDTYRGLERRIADGRIAFDRFPKETYLDRIEYELSVIIGMGFDAYFLIVADFVSYAKNHGIPVGPGRGSGAGSLVAFLIGITDVDPIAFDLLFERFLNPERVSMPDFDIDFCYERREEVIDYVKRKYGQDKVAQIVTFGTLAPRAAVRDVGRALGMPYASVDAVAKLIPRELNITIDEALKRKELRSLYEENAEVKRLIDIARRLEGMPRHASTHAAGVVITEKPTYEYVPLSYSGTGVVTQFDMTTDAKLGLVKFDFLGLRYLTVIDDAEKAVKRRVPDFDIAKIPDADPATFRLLSEGRTDGVFQLESGGMKQVLSRLAPGSLEDIIACIALYRPGPMDSIDTFIARKHGKEKTVYKILALAPILDVTYGCIVYQEQVMQICRALAGYSYAQADIVRRAMAKKKEDVMLAERERFLAGAKKNGIAEADASEVFDEMVSFAKYAFNKSHATAYGILSYRTAYLKAHYPAEYFAALMTSVLDSPIKIREYIADVKKYGVRVLPPDINESEPVFAVVAGNIRFGLLAVRNVGRQFADAVVYERKNGAYRSFDSFVGRLSDAEINKRTMESLIKCGAFDSLGTPRSALLASYETIVDGEHDRSRNNISGQLDLFSVAPAADKSGGFVYPDIPEYSKRELLLLEKESSGMYFSGHMADNYAQHIAALSPDRISDIFEETAEENEAFATKYRDRSKVGIAGIITAKKTKTLKNGDVMAFLRVDDTYGEIEVIVFARQYAKLADELSPESAVYIEGTLSLEEGEMPKILLSSVKKLLGNAEFSAEKSGSRPPMPKETSSEQKTPRLFLKVPSVDDRRLGSLMRLCSLHPGTCEIVLYDGSSGKYVRYKGATLSPDESVLARLSSLFGKENVVFRP